MSDTFKDKLKAKAKKYNYKNWNKEAEEFWHEAHGWNFYCKCPKNWNKLFHIRPLRRRENQTLHGVDLENKGEEVSFCNYKKPHHYYW